MVVTLSGGGWMVSVRLALALCAGVSVSLALKARVAATAVVGVPVMAPVDGFSVRPAGSVPDEFLRFPRPIL